MTATTFARPADATLAGSAAINVGRIAAVLALAALLVGGTLMSISAPLLAAAPAADPWSPLRDHAALFWWAAVGLGLISAFDLLTIPALHLRLSPTHPALILVATVTAASGDLLGVLGRTVQAAEVSASGAPTTIATLVVLEQGVNTAGFALVSVSFACFGLAMLRGRDGWLGVVGIAAGATTGLGQLPGLEPVFYLANVLFVAWYVGLALTLGKRRRAVREPVSGAAGSPGAGRRSQLSRGSGSG
jgi:hypothetical protein